MTLISLAASTNLISSIPVDPGAPDARQWLVDELSKPIYQAAKPTLFDQIAKAVGDWIGSLFSQDSSGIGAVVPVIVVLVVVALLVAGLIVFGRPRLNRTNAVPTRMFGVDDPRTADQLRASAANAATAGDFTAAVEEIFRALATGLAERTIVSSVPGTTAQEFADRAARAFPNHSAGLRSSANLFDGVRYLDESGSAAAYNTILDVDLAVRRDSPVRLEAIATVSA